MRRAGDIEARTFLGIARGCFLALLAGMATVAGCEKPPPPEPAIPQAPVTILDENTTDNLTSILHDLRRSQSFGEIERALAITRRLLPDERRVRLGLSPTVSEDVVRRIVEKNHAEVPTEDSKLAIYISAGPSASQISVTSATTEELAKESTGPAREFPFAARRLAREGVLRPQTTYHLVRLLRPGDTIGVPLHLVFWDGNQWTILGPVWRALRDSPSDDPDPPSAPPAAPPSEPGG